MKRKELLELFKTLNSLSSDKVKFSYFVAKNINLLKPEIETIENLVKPSEEFQQFEEKRVKLIQQYADKNADGNLKFDSNGNITISGEENLKEFQDSMNELIKENSEVLTARENKLIEYENFLEDEVSFNFATININDIPDGITTKEMVQLYQLIEE